MPIVHRTSPGTGSDFSTLCRGDHKGKPAIAQDLKNAHQRDDKAVTAWRMFQQSYSSTHPDLSNIHFTSDFRLAFESLGSPSNMDAERQRIKPVELTAEEQQQLKAMHREITESRQSLRQVEKTWVDYQNELVADHFPSGTEGAVVTLSGGKQCVIPSPWSNGLARFAWRMQLDSRPTNLLSTRPCGLLR